MKDLEKIKSEDLGCQVQDANPGNFAIEQEVGAMVGATVPAPTAPSADDARELGAQLLVFLRRALTPIKSALRTALADIYAHLDSRCTDYTPAAYASYQPLPSYDPMGTPRTPRTLPNLLTAITAFSARKISNGGAPNDGIPDGTSLAHLLCSTDAANAVTEIVDDNYGWTMTRNQLGLFPSLNKVSLGCEEIDYTSSSYVYMFSSNAYTKLDFIGLRRVYLRNGDRAGLVNCNNAIVTFPDLEEYYGYSSNASTYGCLVYGAKNEELSFPVLRNMYVTGSNIGSGCPPRFIGSCHNLKRVKMPSIGNFYSNMGGSGRQSLYFADCPIIECIIVGKLTSFHSQNFTVYEKNTPLPNLIHFEIGQGTAIDLHLEYWNPTNVLSDADKTATFLQNFLEHICQKLANRTGQTKLTLTLSADVYTAIMTDNDIKAELVARNWKVTDGTNNYNN